MEAVEGEGGGRRGGRGGWRGGVGGQVGEGREGERGAHTHLTPLPAQLRLALLLVHLPLQLLQLLNLRPLGLEPPLLLQGLLLLPAREHGSRPAGFCSWTETLLVQYCASTGSGSTHRKSETTQP